MVLAKMAQSDDERMRAAAAFPGALLVLSSLAWSFIKKDWHTVRRRGRQPGGEWEEVEGFAERAQARRQALPRLGVVGVARQPACRLEPAELPFWTDCGVPCTRLAVPQGDHVGVAAQLCRRGRAVLQGCIVGGLPAAVPLDCRL